MQIHWVNKKVTSIDNYEFLPRLYTKEGFASREGKKDMFKSVIAPLLAEVDSMQVISMLGFRGSDFLMARGR